MSNPKACLSVITHRLTQDQRDHIDRVVEALDSRVFHVINDIPYALEKAQQWPGRMIILRNIPQGMHNDDDIHKHMTPAQAVRYLKSLIEDVPDNLWFSLGNEPIPCESQEYISWLHEFCREIIKHPDLKVVVGNFHLGSPDYSAYPDYDPVLDIIYQNPDQLALGVHEYFPTYPSIGFPHLLGRIVYKWAAYRKGNWKHMPNVVLTEYGTDTVVNRELGWDGRPLMKALDIIRSDGNRDAIDVLAKSYATGLQHYNHDFIIGVCVFVVGSYNNTAGGWWHHDVLASEPFLDRFVEYALRNQPVKEAPVEPNGTKTTISLPGHIRLNVRKSPGGDVVTTISNGADVYAQEESTRQGSYTWHKIKLPSGEVGWIAHISALESDPPLPKEPNDSAVHDKLDRISQIIREIKDLLHEMP